MDDSAGCRGCIGLVGSLIGLLAGVVTIVGFFFSDADSFMSAAEQFWSSTVLTELAPTVSGFFAGISEAMGEFAEGSSLAPWWTALLALVLGGITKYLIEWFLLLDVGIKEAFILVIPAALWIWIFAGAVGTGALILFVVVYIAGTLVFSFLLEMVLE